MDRLELASLLLLTGCKPAVRAVERPLKVAAAADLAAAWNELGVAFEAAAGRKVTFSFGSTGLLARQIIEGAPFDVFAAANLSFVDDVLRAGVCLADSRALYARGRIVVWTRSDLAAPRTLAELADPRFVKIAVANPEHAPYGRAALQALTAAGIVEAVRPRLVFGENVQQALAFAQSGNAEAAVVALSLSRVAPGSTLEIPAELHQPIDQAMVVCSRDPAAAESARAFVAYVNSAPGRALMRRYGFLLPGEVLAKGR
jgi:molybdate transport system substrate-binding protein